MKEVNEQNVQVFVEEETSLDSETNHLTEVVGFFAIEVPHTVQLELVDHCASEPEPEPECPGEWTCEDIEYITASDFDYLDANMDGSLDAYDNLELTELG
jgi:hypothetical protein